MLSKNGYIFIVILLLLPVAPSYFLSGSIALELDDSESFNDPFGKKISDIDKGAVLWLDARSKAKYDFKHIPGAIWVNPEDWEGNLARIFEVFDEGQAIVVYCNEGCSSSRSVASRLREELRQGNIFYLLGGMDSWYSNTSQ